MTSRNTPKLRCLRRGSDIYCHPKFFENPYARDNIDEGYLTLQVESGGADSPRQIRLRTKPSTGQWFLWEQFLLSDVRVPVSADPWA